MVWLWGWEVGRRESAVGKRRMDGLGGGAAFSVCAEESVSGPSRLGSLEMMRMRRKVHLTRHCDGC